MRERRRKHDDAHMPLGGKGKRAVPPRAMLVLDQPCPRCIETAARLDALASRADMLDITFLEIIDDCREMARRLRGET